MRLLVGGIIQESNTFSPSRSTMDNFRRSVFLLGDELRSNRIANELGGFQQAVSEDNVEYIPTLFCQAVSSGVFAKQSFQELKQLLIKQLQTPETYDGVYFALHGAMVAEECDDVEGELISIIRQQIGPDKPLVISLDLHANVTERMVRQVQAIVGYQTYPHIDFIETAYRATKLLISAVRDNRNLKTYMRKLPMIVPAENSQTSHGPFADLWREAAVGEQSGASVATSLFPVQPWLDIDELGYTVVVVGEDADQAAKEMDRLAELIWKKRHEFDVELHTVQEVVHKVLHERRDTAPFILSESADSPGAGADGDSNTVLKELLSLGVQDQLTCLLTIVDAEAVATAITAGVGEIVHLSVGYKTHANNEHGQPLPVQGRVVRIGDGRFVFRGGYSPGLEANMGRCVVLQIGKISVLLSEKPTFTGDPSMYRTMGLEPLQADIVVVRSANQFRADYEKLSSSIYLLDTPGYSTANLASLHYTKMKRPFYPFDDHFDWRDKGESKA